MAQRRFDQDMIGVRRWRVWCGLRRPNRNQRSEFSDRLDEDLSLLALIDD
jgi:hypothetical protein